MKHVWLDYLLHRCPLAQQCKTIVDGNAQIPKPTEPETINWSIKMVLCACISSYRHWRSQKLFIYTPYSISIEQALLIFYVFNWSMQVVLHECILSCRHMKLIKTSTHSLISISTEKPFLIAYSHCVLYFSLCIWSTHQWYHALT